MTEPQTAAGWYPDPEDQTQQRWWNGSDWSDERQPAQAKPPGLAAVPSLPTPDGAAARRGDAPSAGKALAAGIAALLCNVLFIPSILALRWAKSTRHEIAESGGALGGAGKATFARVAGWLGVAIGIIAAIVVAMMVAAGGAVVAEASKDADYKNQVVQVMERSNATIAGLDTNDPTPTETAAAMTSLRADIAELESITPPAKVAAEHEKLVGGMRTAMAGLEQVAAAEKLPPAQGFEAIAVGIEKFADGQGQMLDAAGAIESKTF